MQINAVLWDLDDTLYNRREAARQMFPGMLRQCLYPGCDDGFLHEAVTFLMSLLKGSMLDEGAFHALLERYPGSRPYEHRQCRDYYYAHILDYARPFPGTADILQKLKSRGLKLAIVTNITPELLEHQRRKVAALGIAQLFDVIVYSAELGIHKPDRRIFDHTAALLGVPNTQCLFVGDDPDTDVTGALNAGMEAVWLDHRNIGNPFAENSRVHRVSSPSEYFAL